MDFSEKSYIDPAQIAQLAQNQAAKQAQLDQQAQQQKMQMIQSLAQSVGSMVSSSIQASKQKQQQDFLANSLAAKYAPDQMAPQQGPGLPDASGQESSLPAVSTPDYLGQNVIKAGVAQDPNKWSDLAAQLMMKPPQAAPPASSMEIKPITNPDGTAGYARVNKLTGEVQPIAGIQGLGVTPEQRNKSLDIQKQNVAARQENADTGVNRFVTNLGDKLAGAVDPAKMRDYDRLTAGKRLDVFVQATQGKAIKQQVVEASSLLASMLQGGGRGGVVSEKLIEQLTPSTLKGSAKEKLQWLTNNPTSVDQQKFLDLFEQTAKREATAGEDNIRQQQVEALRKYAKVNRLDPKRYKEIQDSIGLSDENIDSNGRFVRTKKTRSVLPNYNDQTNTAPGATHNDPLGIRG